MHCCIKKYSLPISAAGVQQPLKSPISPSPQKMKNLRVPKPTERLGTNILNTGRGDYLFTKLFQLFILMRLDFRNTSNNNKPVMDILHLKANNNISSNLMH